MHPHMSLEMVGCDCTVLAEGTLEGPLPRVGGEVALQASGVHGGVTAVGAPMHLPSSRSPPNPALCHANCPGIHLWGTLHLALFVCLRGES